MLSTSLLVAACAWFSHAVVQGQFGNGPNCTIDENDVAETQSGMNNFIIDMLGSLQFAYALEQCTATNVISNGKWYMYQCNDMDDTVTKTEYFDDQCSTDGIIIETFNATNMTEGDRGHFECGGYNTYARTVWSLDPDCIDGVTIYAALGACTNFGGDSQLNFYCSANETVGQIFTLAGMMPTSTFLPSSTFSFNATLASFLNGTLLPSTTFLLNATLPSLLNATLPSFLNATLLPSTTLLFNATFPMLTTTQSPMMCADEAYCHKWLFSPDQCGVLATIPTASGETILYGRMDECGSSIESTTMIETTDGNISATEPTPISSSTTSTAGTTTGILTSSTSSTNGVSTTSTTESSSSEIRPSLLLTVGMLFSFFFLVSV
jgi:hypothetical protein